MYGQYNLKENNVWTFGSNFGLDFNSGTPVPVSSQVVTLGGAASVSDAGGHLLFYTQGDTVWNKNGQIMPNGTGLIAPYISNGPGFQADQGQLIVPVINNPDQYYIFSIETIADYLFNGDPMACRLYYSIVDMSLDNGLGDVVSGQKSIPLDSGITSQKLIAVPGENCNIWVLTHALGSNDFRVHEVNANGISASPVVSTVGNLFGAFAYGESKLRISPDRKKLFVGSALGTSLEEVGTELFDFNPQTGVVSNPVLLDTAVISFSGCFSADNSKLYVIGSDHTFTYLTLSQYDLSLPSVTDIQGSKTDLDSNMMGNYVKDARLGPDGKVYVSFNEVSDSLSVIDFPNMAGTACGYHDNALPLLHVTPVPLVANGDLPAEYVKPIPDTFYHTTDTALTAQGTLVLSVPNTFLNYTWNDGSTGNTLTVNDTGTFWVTYSGDYCSLYNDTFKVSTSLSVKDLPLARGMVIYPNPAIHSFTLGFNGLNKVNGTVRILDALGKVVYGADCRGVTNSINISNLSDGAYMVQYVDRDHPELKLATRLIIRR